MYGLEAYSTDQVGHLDSGVATFGRSYAASPDELIEQLKADPAIAAADTLLLTIPNQLWHQSSVQQSRNKGGIGVTRNGVNITNMLLFPRTSKSTLKIKSDNSSSLSIFL